MPCSRGGACRRRRPGVTERALMVVLSVCENFDWPSDPVGILKQQ